MTKILSHITAKLRVALSSKKLSANEHTDGRTDGRQLQNMYFLKINKTETISKMYWNENETL
jgi:hypothetical protein